MRDFLKRGRRLLHAGWVLPMVLLALPNCALDSSGTLFGDDPPPPPPMFEPGPTPQTSAVMCDIPKPVIEGDGCAQGDESNIFLTSAATALAEGKNSSLVLDFSPAAVSACGGPKRIEFYGAFPDGSHVCLNCGTQIGAAPKKYADAAAVCVAKCVDLLNQDGLVPSGGAQAYCQANARVSTNVDQVCYADACTNGGTPKLPFNDPRRNQELVKWADFEGPIQISSVNGGTDNLLSKTSGGNSGLFDASVQSAELITHGDAWIEFQANEGSVSHVVGIATDSGVASDLQVEDLAFVLSLNFDGDNVYVVESGAVAAGPLVQYLPGQRFRIEIKDNNDNTATISYSRLDGACAAGTECMKTPLATSQGTIPYPLRVAAMFREPGASLENVTMVRIK